MLSGFKGQWHVLILISLGACLSRIVSESCEETFMVDYGVGDRDSHDGARFSIAIIHRRLDCLG